MPLCYKYSFIFIHQNQNLYTVEVEIFKLINLYIVPKTTILAYVRSRHRVNAIRIVTIVPKTIEEVEGQKLRKLIYWKVKQNYRPPDAK